MEPIGVELDYAENHIDGNYDYYSDIDEESYQRVVCTYREAAEDGNLNALWCLGCALNLRNGISKEKYDVFGLTYYYLSLAIQKGHLACIPSLCELLDILLVFLHYVNYLCKMEGIKKHSCSHILVLRKKKSIVCGISQCIIYVES